jgi:hypothetical protein
LAKITISVGAELHRKLRAYAQVYRETYGETEEVGELIPYVLEAFLSSDRGGGFGKSRRDVPED